MDKTKIAIACQGGGSHTAFTAGVLTELLDHGIPDRYQLIALSGTSGGGICAAAAWYGLIKAAQGSKEPKSKWLKAFWHDNSAHEPWAMAINSWTQQTLRLQESGLLPSLESSPYASDWLVSLCEALAPRREYFDFQRLIEKHLPFEDIATFPIATRPRLLLGAVDVTSGDFRVFDSARETIRVQMLLATAAIPTLFKAVELDGAFYWDGLFSKNPPIVDFLDKGKDDNPDEIWIIRINPQIVDKPPTTPEAILDRRNELAGNLSLNQEQAFIETVNRWLDQFKDTAVAQELEKKYKPIRFRDIEMDAAFAGELDYASKLDRSSEFIDRLIDHGKQRAKRFLVGQ